MEKIATNRKAYFEYFILEKLIAGVELKGSEVKSIRKGEVNISEAYCVIDNGEIFLKNMHVSEHKQGGVHNNHEPLRTRKLLLKKKEILKLAEEAKLKGLTIVPLEIILTGFGYIKLEIGLAKGKKNYDKRESIKEKDLKRDSER